MPELPEVETVRRTLADLIVGQTVSRVQVHRRDVVRGPATLLHGDRIAAVKRLGKQLAIVGNAGGCVCVHLGMSGSLCLRDAADRQSKTDHVHVAWAFPGGRQLWFRDPRRFGGVWAFDSEAQLHETRWRKLGPDGLIITPKQLHAGLSRTRRAIKAALLDQHLVAGLGNIYVDELLYATKLHPQKLALEVTGAECRRLIRAMRRILSQAIEAGGSTLRDYVDADGQAGGFQDRHKVYGRGGQPCRGCGQPLGTMVIAGRTTTACGACQS